MSKTNAPPPPVIPESSVVALQAWKDKSKISNSNWENSLNVPITVNPGDSIFVKASFIDTRGTASGNIDLAVDTEISLEYYFYFIHNFSACNKSELISEPTQPDASNNLNQQVLVGPDIETLFAYNQAFDPSANAVPAYLCDPSGVFQATDINDADGLPYLVYQSSNNIPVPAVYGPVIPASEIVPGTTYVVHTAGISTNWQYAGVLNASKNILNPNWEIDISEFVATNNPNGVTVPPASPFDTNPGMSPSAFLLPYNVQPTLPYVSYMITDLGNTDWIAIDPNLVSTDISGTDMVPGVEYVIDYPGNINWTAWGAANNNTGTEFTYNPPPNGPPLFPQTLTNTFFLDNSGNYNPAGGPLFGADSADTFQCVVDINAAGNYILDSFSGTGPWCLDISANAQWTIPIALLNINPTVCPTATSLIIGGFTSTSATNVPVANLVPGDRYTIDVTGIIDGSNPPFTWNMVTNTFLLTDTTQMDFGSQYQVYDYFGQLIDNAPNKGVLTDVFIALGSVAQPDTITFDNADDTNPNFIYANVNVTRDGVPYTNGLEGYGISFIIYPDASGNCAVYPDGSGLIYVEKANTWLGETEQVITLITGSPDGIQPAVTVSFVSNKSAGDFDKSNIYVMNQTATLVPFPNYSVPSKLVRLQNGVPTPASITYDLTTPNIASVVTYNTWNYYFPNPPVPGTNINPFTINLIPGGVDSSGNTSFFYNPYPASTQILFQNPPNPAYDWDAFVFPNNPQGPFFTINGSAQPGLPSLNLTFAFAGDTGENWTQATLVPAGSAPYPTSQQQIVFTCSAPYTGTGSTSTANGYDADLTAATASGTGFIDGTLFNTAPKVGTIIESLFPDTGNPPFPSSIEFTTDTTQNVFQVVLVYLNGSLTPYDLAAAQASYIDLRVIPDSNGNCIMDNNNSRINTALDWLAGVTFATVTINTAMNGGTLPLLTFTCTGAQIQAENYEINGFTAVAPFVPYPTNPSTGKAAEYPSPYTPYDGTVREVITPAFNKTTIRPVKKKWSMVLKAGSYNPNYLAELISRNMSRQKQKRVNNILNGPFGTQSSLTVPTDSIYNNQSGSNVFTQPISGGANVFYDSKNPAAYDVVPEPNYNLPPDNEDDMPFLFTPAMNSSTLFVNTTGNPTAAQNNYIYAEIPHPNANRLNNLPNPTWYVNLVPLISDVRSISPTIQGTGTPYYTILPFYTQNAVVQGGGSVEGNSGVFPIVFGANQTSLLYNNENNGLFSFNYLHSPMYAFLSSGTSDLTEVTAHMYTTAKTGSNVTGTNFFTTLVDKNSGILLNQMNPPGFWQQLGFRIEDLTVDLDGPKIGYQMKLADFQKKTTGGFCGSSNIFNPVFHTNNSAIQPSCPDTELVFATATPAATPPSAIITAFTGNLTIGSVYRIYYPGQVKSVAGRDFIIFFENDWTPVGGPYGPVDSNLAGTVFTATSTGFDPNNPPDYSGGDDAEWTIAPTVVLADFPESTTTVLQSTYFQVENTNTLDAGNIPTVRDATGHYLVELTGYNSNYIDDSSKREIKAIVSSYWVSPGAFVSVPFPDSYNFYGTGAPQTLSTIKTRILDPFTDQEAILGPNSSIYLQVNRMLSQAAEEQIN